jgi:hypothetical protein
MEKENEEKSWSNLSDIPESLKDQFENNNNDFDFFNVANQNQIFRNIPKTKFKINLDEIREEQSYELENSGMERISKRSENYLKNENSSVLLKMKSCNNHMAFFEDHQITNLEHIEKCLSSKNSSNNLIDNNLVTRNFMVKISPQKSQITTTEIFYKELPKNETNSKIYAKNLQKANLNKKNKKKEISINKKNKKKNSNIKNKTLKITKNQKLTKENFFNIKTCLNSERKKDQVSLILSNTKNTKTIKKKEFNKKKINSSKISIQNKIDSFSNKDFLKTQKIEIPKQPFVINNSKTLKSFRHTLNYERMSYKNIFLTKKPKSKQKTISYQNNYFWNNTRNFSDKKDFFKLMNNRTNISVRKLNETKFSLDNNKNEKFQNNLFHTNFQRKKLSFNNNFCLYQNYKSLINSNYVS